LKLLRLLLRTLRWAVILFFASTILAVLAYKWLPVPITPLMVLRCAQQIGHHERPRLEHRWVPLDSISPNLAVAVIASEDQNFMKHNGFDFDAIDTAIREHQRGKRLRGASTITQQTAKNVFLWPGESWVRKGLEAYFTVLIELFWSKERIMEVYLNSIEMGDGLYGAYAVAHENFGRSPASLTRNDCALIAATLPNPLKYSSRTPNSYMRSRRAWILRQMRHIKPPFERQK